MFASKYDGLQCSASILFAVLLSYRISEVLCQDPQRGVSLCGSNSPASECGYNRSQVNSTVSTSRRGDLSPGTEITNRPSSRGTQVYNETKVQSNQTVATPMPDRNDARPGGNRQFKRNVIQHVLRRLREDNITNETDSGGKEGDDGAEGSTAAPDDDDEDCWRKHIKRFWRNFHKHMDDWKDDFEKEDLDDDFDDDMEDGDGDYTVK